MASLDAFSFAILLGSLLVLAGILSSLVALRFGAPLLLVFLLLGMLAGEGGPGGLKFDSVGTAYTVGSIALALILFDGGLRTRLATFRNVLAPAAMLATVGVLITTLLTAPVAKFALGISWMQALLIGAVVASTDAAAVFLLINARGLRLRPRVRATLEVESGTNDPFAVFLTLLLVEFLLAGEHSWSHALVIFLRDTVLGCVIGVAGGRIITLVLNRLALPQGLHAPFVAVSALVVFASANVAHSSGFLAVYLAGLVVGNRQTRAHNSVVVFLDAVTWLAQIVMFVLLGLLVWPQRMGDSVAGVHRGRAGADAGGAASRGVSLPRAVRLPMAREAVRVLGRLARRGGDFSRFDSAAGRIADGLSLFRRRLRGRAVVAADPGLDRGLRRPQARHVVYAQRSATQTGGARSARPVDARNRRLSGAGQQPVSAPRPDPELGAADAGRAQRRNPDAGGSRSGARGRLRLSAGAAGKGAGARPLLRQYAAAGRARSAAARRFLRAGRCDARRAGRHLRPAGRRRPHRCDAGRTFSPSSSRHPAKTGDIVQLGPIALLAHKVARRPRHHRGSAAGGAGRGGRLGSAASRRCGRGLQNGSASA